MAMTPEQRAARTQARRGAKIVMNKAAVDAMQAGLVDALVQLGDEIIDDASARAPRDPEAAARRPVKGGHATHQGIPMMKDTGGVQVWGLGKLAYGTTEKAAWEQRPKGVTMGKDQVVLVVGFGSKLAHLVELGTVKMSARPFLTPAILAHVNDVGPYVQIAMAAHLASGSERRALSSAIKAARAGTGTWADVGAASKAVKKAETPIRKAGRP